jgi:hypothetical protein
MQLSDSAVIQPKDIGLNFFFRLNDVGRVRSEVVAPRLRELNPLCSVNTISTLNDTAILVRDLLLGKIITFSFNISFAPLGSFSCSNHDSAPFRRTPPNKRTLSQAFHPILLSLRWWSMC